MIYSEVKQSVSGGNTTTDSMKQIKLPEPEYEKIATDPKTDFDVKMDINPAYQATF